MTGSLDADARPMPGRIAVDATPSVRRRTTRSRWFWWAVLVVVTLLGASGVLIGAFWVRELETAPTERAMAWVSDMAEGRSEHALQQICAAGVERHPTGESLREDFESFLGGPVVTVRPGEQVISSGPDGAAVYVPFGGVMADGSSTRFDIKVVHEEAAGSCADFAEIGRHGVGAFRRALGRRGADRRRAGVGASA
jgi:hypothetical protein